MVSALGASRFSRMVRPAAALALLAGSIDACLLLRHLGRDPSPYAALPDPRLEVSFWEQLRGRFQLDRMVTAAIRIPEGVFTHEGLSRLRAAAQDLRKTPGVLRVEGITEEPDLRPTEDGFDAVDLVPSVIPTEAASLADIERRALDNALLRGNLVSEDARAALLVVTLAAPGKDGDDAVVAGIEEAVRRHLGKVSFDGEPYVAHETGLRSRRDAILLVTGLCIGIIVLVVAVTVRCGAHGTGAFLLALGIVLLWGAGARGHSDRPMSDLEGCYLLALVAMAAPLAAGVARLEGGAGGRAVLGVLVCALGAFDMARHSSVEYSKTRLATGFALLSIALLMLVLSPSAFPILAGRRIRPRAAVLALALFGLSEFAGRFGKPARIPEALPAEPAVASERFGQGDVAMVALRGDLHDPVVMTRLADLEDRMAAVPGVSHVTSVAAIARQLGGILGDGWRIPADRGKLGNILFFFEGTPETHPLMTPAADEALAIASLRGDDARTLPALRALVENDNRLDLVAVRVADERQEAAARVRALRMADAARRIAEAGGRRHGDVRTEAERILGIWTGLGDTYAILPRAELGSVWEAVQPEGTSGPAHAHLTGPRVFLSDAAEEVRRMVADEGRSIMVAALLAALFIRPGLAPLLPVALALALRLLVTGPSLVDAGLLPALPVLTAAVLLLSGRPLALSAAAFAATLMGLLLLSVSGFVELPALGEICRALGALELVGAAGFIVACREALPAI